MTRQFIRKGLVAILATAIISPLAIWAQQPAPGQAPDGGAGGNAGGAAVPGFGGGGNGGFGGGAGGGFNGGGFGGGGFGGGGQGGGGFGGGPGGAGFGGGPGGGGFGGFGELDQTAYVQQQANISDDDWKVIQPLLQKVIDAQRAAGVTRNAFGMGGFGGGGGGFGGGGFGGEPGGGGFGAPGGADPAVTQTAAAQPDPVAQAQQDLYTAVQDTSTTPEQFKVKLQSLRDAKAKARTVLVAAQENLRNVLKLKQEAIFVTLGYLD